MNEIVRVHRIKEIIFSAQDIPFSMFTSTMTSMGPGLRYMLAASNTMNIVGSMNRDTGGESYAIRVNFKLSHPAALRAKRIFDLITSFLFLLLLPVLIFFIHHAASFIKNIWNVMSGKYTWVSYDRSDPMVNALPPLLPGVLSPQLDEDQIISSRKLEHINYVYARDYHWTTDLSVVISHWKKTGQKP